MAGREYFLSSWGVGARCDWPPMSAMRSFPQRPLAARWKGSCRRSGQEVTSTETLLKFESSPDLMMGTRESRDGGDRGVFVTDQLDIVDLMLSCGSDFRSLILRVAFVPQDVNPY